MAEDGPNSQKQAVDPRRLYLHRAMGKRDVPYVPTDEAVVTAMLRFAGVNSSDVVYDLGCGDGRIVIAAARQCGARGVGVDIDPLRIQESRENAKKARVWDRVKFYCQSFFDTDFSDATVVMLYLLPQINVQLRPKLMRELKVGTRIVANNYAIGDWQADMVLNAHHRTLHQWIVPAWVTGTWKCIINNPRGRVRMTLKLQRDYQNVSGVAKVEGMEIPVCNGKLFGDQMTFKLYDPEKRRPVVRYSCRVEGKQLRGTCQAGSVDRMGVEWGGVLKE